MTEQKPRWAVEGVLSDEMLDRHRTRLGRTWEADGLLDRSAIDIFARAIGDSNPLWQDPAYAASGPYGAPIAPPGALYRIHLGNAMHGLRGVMGYNIGTAWELLAPVYEGDTIHASIVFDEIEERDESRFAQRSIIEHYRGDWTNQRGELVARSHVRNLRVERSSTRRKGRDTKLEVPHPWSDEERLALEQAAAREPEQIRGGEPLWWEDVEEETALEPLVKGPLRMWDMICWFSARAILNGYSRSIRGILDTPALGMLHPASNAREPIEIVHVDNEAARTAGLPGAYDLGAARQSYQLQSLIHAVGDDAWVKHNSCEYRRFVYLGDAMTFQNTVTRKFVDEDGEHCIEVHGSVFNQRKEDVMPSRSVIALPSREEQTTPARRRARTS
ncbi:MAG: hypothetical protein F4X25_13350 [Chloroflexi bacterium]|nr:hypothetical protein [Chloroflexota bacterium]